MMQRLLAAVLVLTAASCTERIGPPNGWVVPVPGGGFVRAFDQFEPRADTCNAEEGATAGVAEVAFMADTVGRHNDIDEAAAVANVAHHPSVEDFIAAAQARFDCGAWGDDAAPRWGLGATRGAEAAWDEAVDEGLAIRTIAIHSYRVERSIPGVWVIWESPAAPLRISVWLLEHRGGRDAAIRRAEQIAASFTEQEPAD